MDLLIQSFVSRETEEALKVEEAAPIAEKQGENNDAPAAEENKDNKDAAADEEEKEEDKVITYLILSTVGSI